MCGSRVSDRPNIAKTDLDQSNIPRTRERSGVITRVVINDDDFARILQDFEGMF